MKLKILDEFEFFSGIKHDISPCCIIFYESVWLTSIRKQIPDYAQKMWDLSEHRGVLLCPECVIKKLKEKNYSTKPIALELQLAKN